MIVGSNAPELEKIIVPISIFLKDKLILELHPRKISLHKRKHGVDFCGYVVLPRHIVLRTKTKRRMFGRVNTVNLTSYLGLLKRCNGYKLEQKIRKIARNKV